MTYWAVAQTQAQREAVAQAHLGRRGFATYLPVIRRKRQAAPLFPGYVFVQIAGAWYAVNATPGVHRLLLDGEVPARVRDGVLDELRGREDRKGFVILPRKHPLIGAPVRITAGPLLGHHGTYAGTGTQHRERVLLYLFGGLSVTDVSPACLAFD